MEPTRIGNIEFRLAKSYGRDPRDYVDIVCWYPNPDYGTQDQYDKVDKEWYVSKDRPFGCCRKHESCFKYPENCYTVATLEIEEEPDVKSCGLRPFDLSAKDRADFETVVKLAYEYTVQLWKEQNSY